MDRLFVLLQQEGYLFRSCLTLGLTVLRKADLNNPGAYYTAFFQLSTGLERLLKSIIIIEYLAMHGHGPSEQDLRRYGHDLEKLVTAATKTPSQASSQIRAFLAPDTVNHRIISFLADFARSSRYFNLNAIANTDLDCDPIKEWNRLVYQILSEDEDSQRTEWLHAPTDLTGTALRMSQMFKLRQAQELASTHAVARLIRLLAFLREKLAEVVSLAYAATGNTAAAQVPYMIEFLNFTYRTDAENRRKKRWP